MRVAIGWCRACDDLGVIEVLPDAAGELELQQTLEAYQVELSEVFANDPPRKRWWQLSSIKSTKQSNLEYYIKSTAEALAEYQLARKALSSRASRGRCLRCGSDDCLQLPPHEAKYYDPEPVPEPIGLEHPGCSGQLTIFCDDLRFNIRLTEKSYNLEGLLVDENYSGV
ncbi:MULTISPECIES: hypothetical protein [unclassified Pseudomonas]|uniref:hypothetical protein n=1 Tax=unclassified Pseudomonas TaxID=196821 RepID=UPI00131C11B2|nr:MULTISPECIES: hypothetical protein [unclassified Pseudomonas]